MDLISIFVGAIIPTVLYCVITYTAEQKTEGRLNEFFDKKCENCCPQENRFETQIVCKAAKITVNDMKMSDMITDLRKDISGNITLVIHIDAQEAKVEFNRVKEDKSYGY